MNLDQDALDSGLDEIRQGARRDDMVVNPELRARIEPLLRVAAVVHRMASAQPSLAADRQIRTALRAAATQEVVRAEPRPWRRPLLAFAMACAATLVLGVVSVVAAGDALPSSPLYPVRNLREQAQLFLAPSGGERAHLHTRFALERTKQLQALARRPERSSEDVKTLLKDIASNADQAVAEVKESAPGAAVDLMQTAADINQQLEQVHQEADLSPTESQQLSATMQSIQSDADQAEAVSSNQPKATPSAQPTEQPSPQPTEQPTAAPTLEPTPAPTPETTLAPQTEPTPSPAAQPTATGVRWLTSV